MKNFNHYFILFLFVIFSSCEPNELDSQEPDSGIQNLQSLSIPDNFNFKTERDVTLIINDATPNVKYEVYAYSSDNGSELQNITDALNNVLYTGKPYDGIINQVLSLPDFYDKVYISRKDGLEYSYEIKDITNNIVNLNIPYVNRSNNSGISNNSGRTLCGTCPAGIWDNGSFEVTTPLVPALTSRIMDENNVAAWFTTASDSRIEVWATGFRGVNSQSGTQHAELNANLPSALYQRICTSPNSVITWSVWHRGRRGVDVARVRIGDDLSTATVEATMSTGTEPFRDYGGGHIADANGWVNYTGTYTVPATQLDSFLIFESVSTSSGSPTIGNFIDNVQVVETSSGDACRPGGQTTYPGGLVRARIAFEDLWPAEGDYDFNDLVVGYRIVSYLDITGKVESMDIFYTVETVGASYKNAYALQLDGVPPSAISSVTGQKLTQGIVTLNPNGTEVGKLNAVIPFFDRASESIGVPNKITIEFSPAISTAALGTAPFNPFLIVNKDRNYEIHLINKPTTFSPALPVLVPGFAVAFALENNDSNGNFRTDAGVDAPNVLNMPWALNVAGKYAPPLPGVRIFLGYNRFYEWANSGGALRKNWFKNATGNRNPAFLEPY